MNLASDLFLGSSPSLCAPFWSQSGLLKCRDTVLQADPDAPLHPVSNSCEWQKPCREKPCGAQLHNPTTELPPASQRIAPVPKRPGLLIPGTVTSTCPLGHPPGLTAGQGTLAPQNPLTLSWASWPSYSFSHHQLNVHFFLPQIVGPFAIQSPFTCQSPLILPTRCTKRLNLDHLQLQSCFCFPIPVKCSYSKITIFFSKVALKVIPDRNTPIHCRQ